MTGPDRIWAWPWEARPSRGQWSSAQEIVGEATEYIRRDPAVLAALPEVQALIAGAYEAAANECYSQKWKPKTSCDWVQARTAGCIRALTPEDAIAATKDLK